MSSRAFSGSAVVVLALACGCAAPPEIHPEYDDLSPERIAVAVPENRTVVPLDEVGYGGLLQKLVSGPRVFRVRDMIGQNLVRALEEKGYEASFGENARSASGGGARGADAILLPTIESWSEHRTHPPGIRLRLRVRLVDVPGGETLYEAVDRRSMGGDRRSLDSQGAFLEEGLRRAARGVLGGLPERKS